jgi:hypothetical protein
MKMNALISEEVEKTLDAFDQDPILPVNPFLITRIQVEQERRIQGRKQKFALRPHLKFAVIILVVLVNLITAVYFYERNAKTTLQEQLVTDLREDLQIDQSQNTIK